MKFSGKVGFWLGDKESKPDVYVTDIVEKEYVGDIKRNVRRFQSGENQQNDNLVTNVQISIICDLYLQKNWSSVKYVVWNEVNWEVVSTDITTYPRAILTLGGVYNGKTASDVE